MENHFQSDHFHFDPPFQGEREREQETVEGVEGELGAKSNGSRIGRSGEIRSIVRQNGK